MAHSPLISSLIAAVAASPDDLPLRLHLAELLLAAGARDEAIGHAAQALTRDPGHAQAQALMARAVTGSGPAQPSGRPIPAQRPAPDAESVDRDGSARTDDARKDAARDVTEPERTGPDRVGQDRTGQDRVGLAGIPGADTAGDAVDWSALEKDFADVVPPRFVSTGTDPVGGHADRVVDVETTSLRLSDVGGMEDVKKRLELAFFGPMRSPQMRALYGATMRGGLLLYGPPGCGKTFLARAVAGELGAKFVSLSIVDVLNMWLGSSERNLHEIFEAARRNTPCVLFLDELDALGHKRSQMGSSAMRTLGNQLLTELDGLEAANDGLFVLAATNAPWDVDSALRRPGRFDRMVLVLPPDRGARASIIEYHLRARPVAAVDIAKIAAATEDFSGADLAHLCESAAEQAMHDSIVTGTVRMIEQRDFDSALRDVRPSTGPWMATARNVAMYANDGGTYDDLASYLKRRK